jgi:uncharacterized NAD-dependent epimerase/dehydratase family protein
MSNVPQWQARIPIGQTADGVLIYASDDFYRFLARDVFARIGGVTAPTNNDIDENLLDDSGMAEIEAAMMALASDIGQEPIELIDSIEQAIEQQQNAVSSLDASVSELREEIAAIKNGNVLAGLSERIFLLEVEINSLRQGAI